MTTAHQAPPTEQLIPAGKRVPADPLAAPARVSLLNERRNDYGDFPFIIPRLFPKGLTIIFGRGGDGKTTFAEMCAHVIAGVADLGLPVPGRGEAWRAGPDERGWSLLVDFESGADLAVSRSIRKYPWLSLPTDVAGDSDDLITHEAAFPGADCEERTAELEKRMIEQRAARRPLRYATIDHMRAWLGPVPRHANTAQWESDRLRPLNRLGEQQDCAIVMIAHTNKAGEFSGSEQIRASCNAMYQLVSGDDGVSGKLVCIKSRADRKQSWPLTWDPDSGTWTVDAEITPAQAGKQGHPRAVLDYLAEYGPTAGKELCEAVAGITGASVGTIKNALARLAGSNRADERLVCRDRDGRWCIDGTPVATCEVCHLAMHVVSPGQATHPNCGDEGGPPPRKPMLPWGDGIPGDAYVRGGVGQDQAAGLAEVVRGPWPSRADAGPMTGQAAPDVELPDVEDQAAGVCPVCGLLILPDSPHDDCDQAADTGGERWPAVRELTGSIDAVRSPRPLKWVAPVGDPRGEGPGRHHRGMDWVQAAKRADRTVTGYSSRWRPAGLDQVDPARLVITLDKSQAYVAACENVAVSPAPLEHYGRFDCDPRELGSPSPRKDGRPAGLAGVVLIECPAWDDSRLPHPIGPKARPGEPLTIPSNLLELLWKLHKAGAIGRPVVVDSWLGPRHTGLFKRFADTVRGARAAAVHNSPQDQAIKRGSSIALSQLRSEDRGAGIYRPDWHAAILGESMIRIWVRARDAVEAGELLAGMGTVDEVSYVMPEGWDYQRGWVPNGYTVGGKWGQVRPKPIQVKAARVDLTGIDGQRITPAEGHPGHVLIADPVPLGLWVNHA